LSEGLTPIAASQKLAKASGSKLAIDYTGAQDER
jgi:hypothetical protein